MAGPPSIILFGLGANNVILGCDFSGRCKSNHHIAQMEFQNDLIYDWKLSC
jgi:hypothetical protein